MSPPKSQALMQKLKVLVTGSSGFVGAVVVKALREKHPEYLIICVDARPPQDPDEKLPFFAADVRSLDDLEAIFIQVNPHVVIHTAGVVPKGPARYDGSGRKDVHSINVRGTANVIEACKQFGAQALIYTSTCCVVTDDHSHDFPNFDETVDLPPSTLTYGETKAEAEGLILDADSEQMHTCALRPSVILGEEDYQLIPTLHACIAKGETPFRIGTGDNLYDFTSVANVADAHVLAVENLLSTCEASGQAILISNGQPVPFRDFCLAVWGAFGHTPPFTVGIPGPVAWFAGLMSECYTWLSGTPATLSRGSVNDALGIRYANITKAREILGYQPRVDLADAVRISAEAYKARLDQAQPKQYAHSNGVKSSSMNGVKR